MPTANAQGVVEGKFTIPAGVRAGTKEVAFTGQGGSIARASFFGQGTLVTDIRTIVNQITTTNWWMFGGVDPIAQTFTLGESVQADSLDLIFTAVGSTTIAVQIRETAVGIPTQTVLAEGRILPAGVTPNAWTRIAFTAPVRLDAGTEYAIVVLCNDSVSELAVAQLGKFDANAQQWLSSQPYTIGVLLSSSNASTWTAHQDRDLTFRLNCRQYTEAERLVDLGNVAVSGATDLLVTTTIDTPTTQGTGELLLTLPDGTQITSGDNQRIGLQAVTTGNVGVKARLRSDANSSAALYQGTQIISGAVQSSATYVSRAIDADAAGATVKVVVDAIIPSGAGMTIEVSGVDAGDTWLSMSGVGLPKLLDAQSGVYEYQFQRAAVMEARVRVRITLTGSILARPRVRNLRVIVM